MSGGGPSRRFEPLDSKIHDRAGFRCGVESLDRYLSERAAQDIRRGANAVYVLVDRSDPSRVLGYFTLCSLGLDPTQVPDDLRRRLAKYPQVSSTLIGRLAVAETESGHGLGALLLVHALTIAHENAAVIGSCMIVVDAIDDRVAAFYARFGFQRLGYSSRLILPMATAAKALSSLT